MTVFRGEVSTVVHHSVPGPKKQERAASSTLPYGARVKNGWSFDSAFRPHLPPVDLKHTCKVHRLKGMFFRTIESREIIDMSERYKDAFDAFYEISDATL
jgi:hypothetical protein